MSSGNEKLTKLTTRSSLPKSGDEAPFSPCTWLSAAPPLEQTAGPRSETPEPGSRARAEDAPLAKAPQVCTHHHRLASTGRPAGQDRELPMPLTWGALRGNRQLEPE